MDEAVWVLYLDDDDRLALMLEANWSDEGYIGHRMVYTGTAYELASELRVIAERLGFSVVKKGC